MEKNFLVMYCTANGSSRNLRVYLFKAGKQGDNKEA